MAPEVLYICKHVELLNSLNDGNTVNQLQCQVIKDPEKNSVHAYVHAYTCTCSCLHICMCMYSARSKCKLREVTVSSMILR